MTNENAIQILDGLALAVTQASIDTENDKYSTDTIDHWLKAIDRAQNALRQWSDYLKNAI